jgi:mono/diheme cytochrome c family protein
MKKILGFLSLTCSLTSWGYADSTLEAEKLFVRRVQPLFAEKCLACHGNEPKIKGGLDMRTLDAVLKGGDSEQTSLVPGKPEQSPLYLASIRTHADWEAMPPKEADKLYAEQLSWIKDWISAGAPWPDKAKADEIAKANAAAWSAEDGAPVKTSGGLSADWTNRKYKPESLWAYQAVKKPVVKNAEHAVDELIALRLPQGATAAPATDARSFIRRASFDLTGLPPTPEEVENFVLAAAKSESAYSELIDRLLASPHYGERMAQHWLDVTRYADSSGFANDYERGNAWRYRDYVIRSFNTDKAYDRFIQEQIAGDEMSVNDPEKIVATGFLRMGPWELTAMEVAKVARQRFLDDVTNAVGETFLAHSLQCARCHDHKFDPIPTQDYYGIQAVFATTQLAERDAAFMKQENLLNFEEKTYLQSSYEQHLHTLQELDQVALKNAQSWYVEKKSDPTAWNQAVEQAAAFIQSGQKPKGKKQRAGMSVFEIARSTIQKQGVKEEDYPPKNVGFTPEQYGNERVARKGLERIQWELDRYEPYALAVYNGRTPQVTSIYAPTRMAQNRMKEGELEKTCILAGGDPFSATTPVKPTALSVLGAVLPLPKIDDKIEGRRTAFANWVADKRNPLTTRSIVNRVWMWHFGQAIAGNPNNFGSTGKKPSHPELLDWLAASLVENRWSFKQLHRVIMNSAAYRRSSQSPAGTKLSREELEKNYCVFKPRRLSAEELRDNMLATTGELNRTMGGIPNRPEINLEAAMQPRQVMGTFASAWVPNTKPEQRHRRSIYALKLRGLVDPSMEVFNSPAPDFSCESREASTVTPQVFSLFNSENSYARALALAKRLSKDQAAPSGILQRCFNLVYGRNASPTELESCLAHWEAMKKIQADAQLTPSERPKVVRREAVEENTGEKFSFNENLYAYTDFVPDLQPYQVDSATRALADVCLALLNSNEFVYVY